MNTTAPERSLDSLRTLRVAGPIAAAYYAFLAFAHTAVLPRDVYLPMTTAAATTAIVATVFTVLAHRVESWAPWVNHAITTLLLLLIGNSVLHLALVPEPLQTTNLMLAVLATGLLARSWHSVALAIALGSTGLTAVATAHTEASWTHFVFAWIASSMLAMSAYAVRAATTALTLGALDEATTARASLQTAMAETRLSELRYRTVVDHCPDAVFAIANGRIAYSNPAADMLLDVRSGSIVGTRVETLRPPDADGVLGDDRPELTVLDKNSTPIRLSTSTTEVMLGDTPVRIVFARERYETASLHALQQAFLSTVNHELRTPLTTTLGSVRLLDQRHRTPENAELIDVAKRGVDRLQHQIEQLLTLRNGEPGDDTPETLLAVDDVVAAALTQLGHPARARVLAHSDAQVLGQEGPLTKAMVHLIDNALKFDRSEASVDIRMQATDDQVRIHISDRGPGIPLRFRRRIFEEFAQQNAALSRVHGGMGLGLTLARTTFERHGGSLSLHDRDGGGSLVIVTLPIVDPLG